MSENNLKLEAENKKLRNRLSEKSWFDLQLLYEHLEELLEEIDYRPHKKDKTFLMLRRIFGRAGLTPREVQTLRGVIRRIERKMGYPLRESGGQEPEISESMERFI